MKLKSLIFAFVLLLSTPVYAQQNVTTSNPAEIHVQTDTITVMSQKMGRNIKNVVVLPNQYFADHVQQYPVVYLLHGAWGCYSDWIKKTDLTQYANQYGIIIVCPDGQDSWYFDSPIDPKMQFETYVSNELVKYIDSHYRTYPTREMRAITGLSMGGHGALWLAFRHPDIYGSCGSMSGGVDIMPFPNKWKLDLRLGKYETNKDVWASHAVINLVPTLKPGELNITIDDGSEDFFYKVNCNLHDALLKAKIPHDFAIRPGGHTWKYWTNSLAYHMLFFHKAFTEQPTKVQKAKK